MNELPAKGRYRYGVPPRRSNGWSVPDDPASAGLAHPAEPVDVTDPPAEPWLEPVAMGDNNHKGDFGEQLVRAPAAANLNVSNSRDRLGIDWGLTYRGGVAHGGSRRSRPR